MFFQLACLLVKLIDLLLSFLEMVKDATTSKIRQPTQKIEGGYGKACVFIYLGVLYYIRSCVLEGYALPRGIWIPTDFTDWGKHPK